LAAPIDLINMALLRLGEHAITDVRESPAAEAAYPLVRDVALSWAPWTFTTLRTRLARLDVPPASDYSYQYLLPTDPYCLRVRDIGGMTGTFVHWWGWHERHAAYQREVYVLPNAPFVQHAVIVTNADAVVLKYSGRTHEGLWPPLFQQVVMLWLAKSLAQTITGRANLGKMLQEELLVTLDRCVTVDGHQDTADTLDWDGLYLDVRHAYEANDNWPYVRP
jgi:hypothetical protein